MPKRKNSKKGKNPVRFITNLNLEILFFKQKFQRYLNEFDNSFDKNLINSINGLVTLLQEGIKNPNIIDTTQDTSFDIDTDAFTSYRVLSCMICDSTIVARKPDYMKHIEKQQHKDNVKKFNQQPKRQKRRNGNDVNRSSTIDDKGTGNNEEKSSVYCSDTDTDSTNDDGKSVIVIDSAPSSPEISSEIQKIYNEPFVVKKPEQQIPTIRSPSPSPSPPPPLLLHNSSSSSSDLNCTTRKRGRNEMDEEKEISPLSLGNSKTTITKFSSESYNNAQNQQFQSTLIQSSHQFQQQIMWQQKNQHQPDQQNQQQNITSSPTNSSNIPSLLDIPISLDVPLHFRNNNQNVNTNMNNNANNSSMFSRRSFF